MSSDLKQTNSNSEKYLEEVTELSDKVKSLALNLAINLARSKNEASELRILEPEFTKLVNGSVNVVKEVAMIVKAFNNEETMVFSPTDSDKNYERIERALNEIHRLSKNVLDSINEIKSRTKNEKSPDWNNIKPGEGR